MPRTIITVASIVGLLAAHAAMAQCPPAPANASLETGVCSMRLTWTIPVPGQVATVVIRRGVNSTFGTSIPIATVSPLIPFYVDTPPQSGTDYTYWIVFLPAAAQCPTAVSVPLPGRPFQSGTPAPSIVASSSTCASVVTIAGATVFDATSYYLARRAPGETSFTAVGGTQTGPVFIDATPGAAGRFEYGVVPIGDCGTGGVFFARAVNVNGPPVVTAAPARTIGYGGSTTLTFGLSIGDSGSATLFRNNVPIDGPATAPLGSYSWVLPNAKYGDAGSYFLRVTTPCGSVDSPAIVVAVREKPCPVDFSDNDARDIDDIFVFLNRWFAGCP